MLLEYANGCYEYSNYILWNTELSLLLLIVPYLAGYGLSRACREAMRSTLDKAYHVKYTRCREVIFVGVHVLEQKMQCFRGFQPRNTSFYEEDNDYDESK